MQSTISSSPNAAPVAALPLADTGKRTKRASKPAPAVAAPAAKPNLKQTRAKIQAALESSKPDAKPAPVAKLVKPAAKPEPKPEASGNVLSATDFAKLVGATPVMLRRALRGLKTKRSTKRWTFDRSSPEFASLRAAVRSWLDTDARTKEGKASEAEAVAPTKPAKRTKR
jgi:hypothetical protein